MGKRKATPQIIKDHWADVNCIGPHPALAGCPGRRTIHHCHSGSLSEIGIRKGLSQKSSDYLVVCLPESVHTGNQGIDSGYGVKSWEHDFITQVELLEWTGKQLGVNLFDLAGVNNP